MATATTRKERGTIERDAIYSLAEFTRVSGLGEFAIRRLRKEGLPIRRVGSHSFIRGCDFHDHIERFAKIVLPDGTTCDPDSGIGAEQDADATT